MEKYRVSFVASDDKSEWRSLFAGYAEFYKTPLTAEIVDQVWRWLLDPSNVFEGLIVRDEQNKALGIVHVRACPRSLSGCEIGFVDDMFIDPAARGSGAADALVARLKTLAEERGWPLIRWVTQHFNERGRAFYDRYTDGPSDFIVYQMKLG